MDGCSGCALARVLLLPLHGIAQESLQSLLQRLSTAGELQIAGASVYDLSVTQEFYARDGLCACLDQPRGRQRIG